MPKRKVAILGGGVGAMSAAWSLSNYDGWQADWDITVYQMGWRLGGKGASGRNLETASRIEEHGLHMWMGFYHNAFRMMQEAYAECQRYNLSPGSPVQTWRDAFKPQTAISVAERLPSGWDVWTRDWGYDPEGDPAVCPFEKEPWHFILDVLKFLVDEWESAPHFGVKATSAEQKAAWPIETKVRERVKQALTDGTRAACATPLHLALRLAETIPAKAVQTCEADVAAVLHLLEMFASCAWQALENELDKNDFYRRLGTTLDFFGAVARGLLADDVIVKGFDSIDGWTLSDWIARHGGNPDNDLIRSFSDSAFAYENGDPARPNWAAGTALRAVLRLTCDHPGSVMWKMQGGMGDIVFGPFYKALRNRGVSFRFFHKVDDVIPEPGGSVAEIRITRQVKLLHDSYEPLVDVKGLPCWPNRPLWDQIENGAELEASGIDLESYWTAANYGGDLVLRAGADFDVVVMGISLGALPFAAAGLVRGNQKWQDMTDRVKTVPTQAFQLWLNESATELGWSGTTNLMDTAMISGYVEPHDTYADMSHLIPRECWTTPIGQIAYFCNAMKDEGIPLDDPDFPKRQLQAVFAGARSFLASAVTLCWPKFVDQQGAPRWDVLVDSSAEHGESRLRAQFFRANYEPSERFALSLAGTLPYRIPSGDSGYSNLVLAGDWTRNGLNTGCVEAAVMSGMQASRALCGRPSHIVGETDFG